MMIALFTVSGLVILQMALIAWLVHRFNAQEKKLIKALMSKDVQDFVSSEIREERPSNEEEVPKENRPLSELDDEEFDELIRKQAYEEDE